MADAPKNAGESPQESRPAAGSGRTAYFAKKPVPDVPPSKPLQWFLLAALVITGAAYVCGKWTEMTLAKNRVPQESRLSRLVRGQSEYLAHRQTGDAAFALKHYEQAVSEYRLALQGQNNPAGHELLGQALLKQGQSDAAIAQFQEALRLNPGLVAASSAWGLALMAEGQTEEACKIFQEGLQLTPNSDLLHHNLAAAQFQLAAAEDHLGQYTQAIAHYEKVLSLTPDDPATLNNLALLYATATNAAVCNPAKAVQWATRACNATAGQSARYLDTLARAYAAGGDFAQAIAWEDKALHRAAQGSDENLTPELQARRALFLDHKVP